MATHMRFGQGREGTRWRLRLGAALLGAVVALAGRFAGAADVGPEALPITVVTVKSDDAFDQAEALTQALRKAIRDSEGWSLGEGDYSLEFLALKLGCTEPIDASCEAKLAEVVRADRFLWSVIRLQKEFVVGEVNLYVRGKGTSKQRLHYASNLTEPNEPALIAVAKEAVDAVTGGPPKGSVHVSAGGIAAQIFVDGEPRGALDATGGTFQLPAGNHEFLVKAAGYVDAKGSAKVLPAGMTELALTLEKVPEKGESADVRAVMGFVSLGAGVAAGAVGVYAALKVNSLGSDAGYEAYRAGFQTSANVCDAAEAGTDPKKPGALRPDQVKDLCGQANTMELMQAITFPVAAVAAGVGAYLIGTSRFVAGSGEGAQEKYKGVGQKESAWTVVPLVGVHEQRLNVVYRF
ncbi:MAG: hypothetical protein HY744_25065 [Deltaproteobacteria bacterium]|nr:hypothetical protein [Deltaproteobacteria bacterium]